MRSQRGAPRWATALLARLAPPGRAEDVVGDLEEVHRARVERRGRTIAFLLTSVDALVMAWALQRSSKGSIREQRTLTGISWLDFKLGFRMLARYPGLTIVGGLAIAFAICAGTATSEFATQVLNPTLPLDDGDRVVGIVLRDQETAGVERRALHDFPRWREGLRTVDDLGAFRSFEHNLILDDERGHSVSMAEMSASGFRLARVSPLLGRVLEDSDERADAPPVVVVGHGLWQRVLHGDPDVIGRSVHLGREQATIVGVMPEGFAFPVHHELWAPLRLDPAGYAPRTGPGIGVFGRLAQGATLGKVQAELTALGLQAAADAPETHGLLAPSVVPFPRSILDFSGEESLVLGSIQVFVLLLLVLVCGNVALLLFARATTREAEIVVRSALGASRRRIVGQLLVEALVLGTLAALFGVAVSRLGLRWWLDAFERIGGVTGGDLPFWIRDDLSPSTLAYAVGLTLLGAAIMGVLPGLKATRGLRTRLQQGSSAERAPFGGVWTAVVVAQVAVTVAVPAFAYFVQRDVRQIESVEVGFAEQEVLSVGIELRRDPEWSDERFQQEYRSRVEQLEERIAEEPLVLGTTVADRLPRMYHPHRLIKLDEGGAAPLDSTSSKPNCAGSCVGYRVSTATVDADFFDVLDTPILSGRGFSSGDLRDEPAIAIVNESFVERVLGGRSAVGRRLRFTYFEEWGRGRPPGETAEGEPGPWLEIVGVVPDLGTASAPDPKVASVYLPMPEQGVQPLHLAVHTRGDPRTLEPTLRTLATRIDPNLRIASVLTIDEIDDASLEFYRFWFWLILLVSSIAMLLSLLGIYSVMSFTGSRRTREIGIRVALGSSRSRIAVATFRRPLTQVGLGVLVGTLLTGALAYAILGSSLWPTGAGLVGAYAVLMLGVCLLACIVPTRRALRVQPTEALRADG